VEPAEVAEDETDATAEAETEVEPDDEAGIVAAIVVPAETDVAPSKTWPEPAR